MILLGASVRAAAHSALRAGYQPYAIDLFADRDLAAVAPAVKIARYPRDFPDALAAAPSAAWIYTGGLENHPRIVDRLAALRPLLGNPGDVLRQVRDPMQIGRLAGEADCRFPPTRCRTSAHGLTDERNKTTPSQWLVKPLRSSGGVAIRMTTSNDLMYPPRGTYLQQQIAGDSLSAVFVAAGGGARLLGATKQLLGRDFGLSRPFLYVGSVGPIALAEEDRRRMQSLGNLLAECFRVVGLFNVDFVRNEAGLWPLEVNPRYSASAEVLERAGAPPLIEMHSQACQYSQVTDARSTARSGCFGKAVVYAAQDGIVPRTLDDLVNEWNADGEWPGVADLPSAGDRILRGQPAVTVFGEGDSTTSVEAELRRRVTAIERLWQSPSICQQ
ncbi:MAG: ATP-grasp domain-containing protein [Planctomycetia bacterium]|nr:ATP-grasp domain-containing protein [Planctomycetia bacterium]